MIDGKIHVIVLIVAKKLLKKTGGNYLKNNDYFEFKITYNPCIVCGSITVEIPALRGSKMLSEYSDIEGPICSKCVPIAVQDPHYTVSRETEDWYIRYLKEKIGNITRGHDPI